MRIDKTICDACAKEINETRRHLSDFPHNSERKGLGIHLKVAESNAYRDFCNEGCLRDFLNKHFPKAPEAAPTP